MKPLTNPPVGREIGYLLHIGTNMVLNNILPEYSPGVGKNKGRLRCIESPFYIESAATPR